MNSYLAINIGGKIGSLPLKGLRPLLTSHEGHNCIIYITCLQLIEHALSRRLIIYTKSNAHHLHKAERTTSKSEHSTRTIRIFKTQTHNNSINIIELGI